MRKSRRGFITATAALAASELSRRSIAAEPRDGRAPMTQKEMDGLIGSMFKDTRYTCVRTLESNDGPFYYESSPLRRGLAEGRKGVKLKLIVNIANATPISANCAPLEHAVVDVWHADAEGMYSNVGGDVQNLDTRGATFMRGHQVTGREGRVEFDTVVPGWELVTAPAPLNMVVRATHIHVKVFHDHKIATTQLYFPDEMLDQLYKEVDPYRANRQMTVPGLKGQMVDRIRNGDDRIFNGDMSTPMKMERQGEVLVAQATIGIGTIGTMGTKTLFR
jgi:protocatechuate 3,4-dioxygenase beta subunit